MSHDSRIRFLLFPCELTEFHGQTTTFEQTVTPSPLSASFAWDWRHPSLRLRHAGKCQSSETQQHPKANGDPSTKRRMKILWF